MTKYFYYVVAGAQCDGMTQPYRVKLGASVQGYRDIDFLRTYAKSKNHYFAMVSPESDIFMSNLLESLREFDIHLEHVDGRELVKLFKQHIKQPLPSEQLHAKHYQLKMLDLSYRIISNLNRMASSSAKRSTSKT